MNPHIQTAVDYAAKIFDTTPEDIMSRSRKRPLVLARQALMVGVRGWGLSLAEAGAYFGRDHATVLHAERCYQCLSVAKHPQQQQDYFRMHDVATFTASLRSLSDAVRQVRREERLKEIWSMSEIMTPVEIIHAHASELARLLPDEHPLKAGIERLTRLTNLAPTGGTATTNAAK